MSFTTLEEAAAKNHLLSSKVMKWRISDDFFSSVKYFYWRNRYPISMKIFGRLMLLFEIYLIYAYFHKQIAASISLLFLVFFALRHIHRGITQVFRVRIVELQSNNSDLYRISKLYTLLFWATLFYGLLTSSLLTAFLHLADLPYATRAYSTIWILIFPLQLISGISWMTVYTRHRIRRSLLVNVCGYIIPAIGLMSFHETLGINAYFISLAVGKLLHYLEPYIRARYALKNMGIRLYSFSAEVFKSVKSELSNDKLWKHSLLIFIVQIYLLSIALFLYLQGSELILTHFVFISCMLFLSYPLHRAMQSMAMDIYLSIKNTDLTTAKIYKRRATNAALLFLLIEISIIIFYIFISILYFGITDSIFHQLAPYLILSLITRSFFEMRLTYLSALGSERHLLRSFFLVLIIFGVPAQYFLIEHLRANLQAVYMLDIFLYCILNYFLWHKNWDEQSPIYISCLKSNLKNFTILPAVIVNSFLGKLIKSNNKALFCLIILNEKYASSGMQNRILKKMAESLDTSPVIIKIYSRCYILAVQGKADSSIGFAEEILRKGAYHIRKALPVSKETDLKKLIDNLGSDLPPHALPKLLLHLHSSSKSGILEQAIEHTRTCYANDGPMGEAECFLRFLKKLNFHDLPHILFNGKQRINKSFEVQDIIYRIYSFFRMEDSNSDLIGKTPEGTAALYVMGKPICLIDIRKNIEGNKLIQAAAAMSVVISLKKLSAKDEMIKRQGPVLSEFLNQAFLSFKSASNNSLMQ